MKQNTSSQRIVAEIRARIRSGALAPGDHVPSAREIVKEHGVAIATATKVLALLRREGLVRSKPGIGTIVRGEKGVELSQQRIVETAISIADDEGLEALSMRLLAKELGVATMSLYRHVASREALILLMADAVLAEAPLPGPGSKGWRKQLELIARAEWDGYHRHPWLGYVLSMTRPQALVNGMRHTEAVLEALDDLGLEPQLRLQTCVMLLSYIRGMAVSLEQELSHEQDSGLTSSEWMATQEAMFEPLVAKFPALARMAREPDVDMSIDTLFECGLATLFDGLAMRQRGPKPNRA